MAYETLNSLAFRLDRILDHQNSSCIWCSQVERSPSGSKVERRRFYSHFLCKGCFSTSSGEERRISSSSGGERCSRRTLLQKKPQIQSLHQTIVFFTSFLQDFPQDAANLNARLTSAAKQAEEAFDYDLLPNIVPDENDPKWQHFSQELEKLIEEFDSLMQEAKHIKYRSKKSNSFSPSVNTILGFEEELIEMKGRVCGEPSSQLQIIPIVGMGGIGKTTLARYTYQNPSTTHHFDVLAWVTVSQNSSAKIILSTLLGSIGTFNKIQYLHMEESVLVVHVHRYLKMRRYLIVLDDMWDTNVWDDVRMAFPDDCNGSRIIITTRDLHVASSVDSSNKPHMMQLMSEDQSWRLLKQNVFGHEHCPPGMELIGKHIAEKCKGLPLAVVVIAGVLSKFKGKQESWEKIARNVSEIVNSSEENFTDILSMSYMHLPPHLRPCFLYMGCFPEDYEINVVRLINFWVAEGFLVSDEPKDMEELGYEYLEDLARRNLLLIVKESYDGKIKAVKIHDVLRDLCIRKGRDANLLCIINEFEGSFPGGIKNSQRLSICSNVWGCIPNMDCTSIHTILIFSGHWAFDYWKCFKYLKVLDVMTLELRPTLAFASEICELIHLRYLALSFRLHSKAFGLDFPESVTKLKNLQIFIMRPCGSVILSVYLPIEVWRMQQLRHVILHDCVLPDPSTYDCLPLRNLHALCNIRNFTCSERILKLLPNLKKLGISYLAWDLEETGWSKYELSNLIRLACLEKLSICVYNSYKKGDVPQNLAFPVTLKILTLSGGVIPWEEMSIVGSLPNLEVLKIKRNSEQGDVWETTEGEFCELKVLLIDTTGLQHWITESSHFPSLERLTLYECDSLEEIPCDIGEIPTLQLIEVDFRNIAVVKSAKDIQEEQRRFGNDIAVNVLKSRSWKRESYF